MKSKQTETTVNNQVKLKEQKLTWAELTTSMPSQDQIIICTLLNNKNK